MIVLLRSVTPVSLISHLPLLCHFRRLPLVVLHPSVNSRMLAEAVAHAAPMPVAAAASHDADDAMMDTSEPGQQTARNKNAGKANKKAGQKRRMQLCAAVAIRVRHVPLAGWHMGLFNALAQL